jgi:hypothetical protein
MLNDGSPIGGPPTGEPQSSILKKGDYICIINFNSNVLLQTLSLNVGSSQK